MGDVFAKYQFAFTQDLLLTRSPSSSPITPAAHPTHNTSPAGVSCKTLLRHLGLWDVPKRHPKRGRGPPVVAVEDALLVYAESQVVEYDEAYYIPEYLLSQITCGVTAGMVCVGNGENWVYCGVSGVDSKR
jgi:hypothetical protein